MTDNVYLSLSNLKSASPTSFSELFREGRGRTTESHAPKQRGGLRRTDPAALGPKNDVDTASYVTLRVRESSPRPIADSLIHTGRHIKF